MQFPTNFDATIYRNRNKDLLKKTDKELLEHYELHGLEEGRICGQITNRSDLIKFIDSSAKCLELGPFDCPVLTGPNVKYFDVLNRDELIIRSKKLQRPYNSNNVPHIDYVNPVGDLSIIQDKFDVVLSCHSIEHQINLIKHLKDVSNLLTENGFYIVICPDKRYCFDHFLKESTIADIIHMNSDSKKHSIKSVIEHRSLITHNDCARHWKKDHGQQTIDIDSDSCINAVKEYENTNEYIDVHSLQFTPESFEKNINLLKKYKYSDFECLRVYPTKLNNLEFYAVLRKSM